MTKSLLRGISRKQASAIEAFLKDRNKSMAKALREAGYSESVARKPQKVFGSPIVLSELGKRGFDHLGLRIPKDRKTSIYHSDLYTAILNGLNKAKAINATFEPENSEADKDKTDVFTSVCPALLRG